MSDDSFIEKTGRVVGAATGGYHGAAAGVTAFTTVKATLGTGAVVGGVAGAPLILGALGAYAGYKGGAIAVKFIKETLF